MIFQDSNLILVNTVQVFNDGGLASGVLLDRTGKIGTSPHAIEGSKDGRLFWVGSTQHSFGYKVLAAGTGKKSDVAILQSEPNIYSELRQSLGTEFHTPLFLTRRAGLSIGEIVAISGYPSIPGRNPVDEPPILTLGIIGLVPKTGPALVGATVYPGNSGGPCFTESGEVVGIVVTSFMLGKAKPKIPRRTSIGIHSVYSEIVPISAIRVLAKSKSIPLLWKSRDE